MVNYRLLLKASFNDRKIPVTLHHCVGARHFILPNCMYFTIKFCRQTCSVYCQRLGRSLQCSMTALTGESQFQKCGWIPRMQTAAPLGGKQTVDPLDQ
jgi:hypothetical protein